MQILKDEPLSAHTTFKMGGRARLFIIPESEQELIEVINSRPLPRYIIGGGSNLLINDEKTFDEVISLKSFAEESEPSHD